MGICCFRGLGWNGKSWCGAGLCRGGGVLASQVFGSVNMGIPRCEGTPRGSGVGGPLVGYENGDSRKLLEPNKSSVCQTACGSPPLEHTQYKALQ